MKRLVLLCGALRAMASPAAADDPEGMAFFESKVRPVLVAHCYECHSAKSEKLKGGLRLDTRDAMRAGGDTGPAVVPGDPDASLVLDALAHSDDFPKMPPKAKLPDAVRADFRRWIERGAPDPRDGSAASIALDEKTKRDWWSLRPLNHPPLPEMPDAWCRNPIDVFVLARLRGSGLGPSPEADRRTLIRRVTFDLTGLPPTPEEIESFTHDPSPIAYERLVDRLLASPHYGERWARHWMDVVHYAETHGHDQDRIREHAWPYRDYLIESFNRDTPYARFISEQVAADALFPNEPRLTVALGFLAAGPWDESSLRDIREDSIDREIGRYLDRDDIVSTVMSTVVSSTVHCARCHDHKFDPIAQEDYYSLQAVFAGTDRATRAYDADPAVGQERARLTARRRAVREPKRLATLLDPGPQAEAATWEAGLLADLLERPSETKPPTANVLALLDVPAAFRTDDQRRELAALAGEAAIDAELAKLPPIGLVYAGAHDFAPDAGHKPSAEPRPVHVLGRGDIHHKLAAATPGTIAGLEDLPPRFDVAEMEPEAYRRAALAQWLTDPRNPLTWRSIVNRTWHYHFGRGIADTPNDLGRMGGVPSHPELLDWLAATFRDGGGSLKALHRLIVTSATYRQSSAVESRAAEVDADNRLLGRMNRTRLDAEQVRDAILAVSGRLDPAMGGPSVRQFVLSPGVHVTPVVDYSAYDWDSPGSGRRAVYRFVFRTLPDPFLDSLDAADASQLTAARNVSVTPLQALAMLNDPFMLWASDHFARRLEAERPDRDAQLRRAIELAYGHPAADDEAAAWTTYADRHGLPNACRMLLNSNEFLFVD